MDNPRVESIWYQPPSDGVQECVSIELPGGPKRFLRIWPGTSADPEWGWVVHETAELVWRSDRDRYQEYGVFDEEGELDIIKRSLDEARDYAQPEHGDVIKVRAVTKVKTNWEPAPGTQPAD